MADILRTGDILTVGRAAELFGVSRRTAQRDFLDVELLVAVTVDQRKTGDGWVWRMFRKEDVA